MSEEQKIPSYFERMRLIKLGLLPKEAVAKPKKPLKQVSDKKRAEIAADKSKGCDSEIDLFYETMLKRCKGKCLFCNAPTKNIKLIKIENEKWSKEANERAWEREQKKIDKIPIAHLLPKRSIKKGGFPSVATHEDNWIELCWQCHHSFDSGKITWIMLKDSKEWDIIKEKILNVLPVVAIEERKHKLYSQLETLVYGN